MTTTTTAAGNGSTDTATTGKPERLTGMAQVREAEAYHTASVMHDAPSAAETASPAKVRDQAAEALRCLYAAQNHLQNLTNYEPPF